MATFRRRRTPGPRISGFLAALVFVVAAGCSGGDTNTLDGAVLFDNNCARCHGAGGGGGIGPAVGAGSRVVDLSDAEITAVIRSGPGAMPAFGGLTDEQVASLVAHLRELQAG